MGWLFCNNYNGAVRTAFNSSATAIEIEPELPFVSGDFSGGDRLKLTLVDGAVREIVDVTAITQQTGYTQCTVVRAMEGTTAVSWGVAKKAQARVTAEEMDEMGVLDGRLTTAELDILDAAADATMARNLEGLAGGFVDGDTDTTLLLAATGLTAAVTQVLWTVANANTSLAITIGVMNGSPSRKTLLFMNDSAESISISFAGTGGVLLHGFPTINLAAGDYGCLEFAMDNSLNAMSIAHRTFTP